MTGTGPINSHWLQKALLKEWANEAGEVSRLDIKRRYVRRYPLRRAGSEPGFYAVLNDIPEAEVEAGFNEIERKGLPILRSLAQGVSSLTSEDRQEVARYCAMSITRSRGWRMKLLDRVQADAPKYVADYVGAGLYTKEQAEVVVHEQTAALVPAMFSHHAEPMAEVLLNCLWVIMRTPAGASFVIGDRHGVVIDSAGGGLGYAQMSHLVPIAPGALLCFDPSQQSLAAANAHVGVTDQTNALSRPSNDGVIREIDIERPLVRDINLCAIAQSADFVFGHDSDYLRALNIRSHKSGSHGPTFEHGTRLMNRLRVSR